MAINFPQLYRDFTAWANDPERLARNRQRLRDEIFGLPTQTPPISPHEEEGFSIAPTTAAFNPLGLGEGMYDPMPTPTGDALINADDWANTYGAGKAQTEKAQTEKVLDEQPVEQPVEGSVTPAQEQAARNKAMLDNFLGQSASQQPGFDPSAGEAPSPVDALLQKLESERTQRKLTPQETIAALGAINRADPRSIAGSINDMAQPLLRKLGPIGSGISKGVDLLEQVGDAARGAAERGVLGGVAPNFQTGVQRAAERRIAQAQAQAANELRRAQAEYYAGGGADSASRHVSSRWVDPEGYVTFQRRDGSIEKTNIREGRNIKIVQAPGGGAFIVNGITGERLGTLLTNEEAASSAALTAGSEQEAKTAAELSAQERFAYPTLIAAQDLKIDAIDATLLEAGRAMGLVGYTTTGIIGELLKNIPGTDANTLKNAIQPIIASLGFDELTKMREASKTGGALGQVSELELTMLQSALTSLSQAQSPEVLKDAIGKVIKHYTRWKELIIEDRKRYTGAQVDEVAGFRVLEKPNT